MSYPYPEDRTREKRTKGEEPYKDNREAMRESEVRLTEQEEEYGEEHLSARNRETTEQRRDRIEADMARELDRVGQQVAQNSQGASAEATSSPTDGTR